MLLGIFIHLISLLNELFFSLPQISLFCVIYLDSNCEEAHIIFLEKRHWAVMYRHPHSSWCRKKMQNQRRVQLDTLPEWCHLSSLRGKLRHAVKWLTQTNQTNCCLLYEAQTPTLCTSGISGSCFHAAIWGLRKHIAQPAFFPFSHDRLVRICIDVFFSMIKKEEKKNTLFMETAMYSMMDVLFRLREGECNDWRANEQKATQFEYSWFIKGTMKEQISPFFPLISSFVWPLVSFFFLLSKTCF